MSDLLQWTAGGGQAATVAGWGFGGVVAMVGGGGSISGFVQGFSTNNANSQYFSASPTAGSQYAQENAFITNGIAALCHAAGLKVYLGFYILDGSLTTNGPAPLNGDWTASFTAWNAMCQDMAAGAAHCNMDGLAFDTEGGANNGGFGILWSWNYTGHGGNSQATINAAAQTEGGNMMSSINTGWRSVKGGSGSPDIVMYASTQVGAPQIPGSYYDTWAAWYDPHEGGSYPAANTAVFYQWVYGLANNSAGNVTVGSSVFYGQADVTQFGPYGSSGSGIANPWAAGSGSAQNQSALRDNLYGMANGAPGGGAFPSNLYLVPFIWPGSDSTGNDDGGQWPSGATSGAAQFQGNPSNANAFLPNVYAINGSFPVPYLWYSQKDLHNPPTSYNLASDTGVDYVTPKKVSNQ